MLRDAGKKTARFCYATSAAHLAELWVQRCYIGSTSASPTACLLRGYGRASTQNDRFSEEVILSTGTPIPPYPRNRHAVGDADLEPICHACTSSRTVGPELHMLTCTHTEYGCTQAQFLCLLHIQATGSTATGALACARAYRGTEVAAQKAAQLILDTVDKVVTIDVHACYIGSTSASPTACLLRGSGRAGTQNDRLGEAVILSTGTPGRRSRPYPRGGHAVGDAEIEPIQR